MWKCDSCKHSYINTYLAIYNIPTWLHNIWFKLNTEWNIQQLLNIIITSYNKNVFLLLSIGWHEWYHMLDNPPGVKNN